MTQPPYGDPGGPWQAPPTWVPPSHPPQPAAGEPASAPPGPGYPNGAPPAPAYPASAPPGYPASAPPGYPTSVPPGYPTSAPPTAGWPPGPSPYPPYYPTPPKSRRGLIIVSIVLVLFVLLGGGGATVAYFLTRDRGGVGQVTPQAAVEHFLQAVYVDQNPTKAAAVICQPARDPKKITAKIDEIKQQNKQYDTPRYSWGTPSTDQSGKDRAVLSTTVKLDTANLQQATQKLRFTVVHGNGWFVCDVERTG